MLVRRLGGAVIRGSSTHTGARALRDYYTALVKDQVSPVLTPDGPRGPRFKFKPGALLLAQMSGRPILPMAYAASRAWLVKWDKFVIPKPFARIVVAIGEPVYVPRVIDAAGFEALQAADGGAPEAAVRRRAGRPCKARLRASIRGCAGAGGADSVNSDEGESKQGLSLCSFFVVRESPQAPNK